MIILGYKTAVFTDKNDGRSVEYVRVFTGDVNQKVVGTETGSFTCSLKLIDSVRSAYDKHKEIEVLYDKYGKVKEIRSL